jgi:uncharacterized repeat protein (TIGR03803 family)
VLYSFKGGSADGEDPLAGLTNVNGMLYGTTYEGGANRCGSSGQKCGTVFTLAPSGTESVLHSFGAGTDGAEPEAGLTNVNGTLYGTTSAGGVRCRHGGCGTIFAITISGTETVLHSFGAGTDGMAPAGDLLNITGTLYSTTRDGGKNDLGTVFSIRTDGKGETVLHSFAGGPGGRRIPVCGPHRRRWHALRDDRIWRRVCQRRNGLLVVAVKRLRREHRFIVIYAID